MLSKYQVSSEEQLNNMERLVVMDYSDSSVNIYENPEDKTTEELLEERGHNIDECSVMFCESVTINLK